METNFLSDCIRHAVWTSQQCMESPKLKVLLHVLICFSVCLLLGFCFRTSVHIVNVLFHMDFHLFLVKGICYRDEQCGLFSLIFSYVFTIDTDCFYATHFLCFPLNSSYKMQGTDRVLTGDGEEITLLDHLQFSFSSICVPTIHSLRALKVCACAFSLFPNYKGNITFNSCSQRVSFFHTKEIQNLAIRLQVVYLQLKSDIPDVAKAA